MDKSQHNYNDDYNNSNNNNNNNNDNNNNNNNNNNNSNNNNNTKNNSNPFPFTQVTSQIIGVHIGSNRITYNTNFITSQSNTNRENKNEIQSISIVTQGK